MSILELLQEFGVATRMAGSHHHATIGWVQVDCPFCSPDSLHFRLGITEDGRAASCWSCGRISAYSAVHALTGLDYATFRERLPDIDSKGASTAYNATESKNRLSARLRLPEGSGTLETAHRLYILKRRLDPDKLTVEWGVQGIGPYSQHPWRLLLPIHHKGEVVSYTTRSISDKVKKRYINAKPEHEKLPAKSVVFGLDHVTHSCVIVEGPLDAYTIGYGGVATLGVTYTQAQLRQLAKVARRTVCFDSEEKAQQRARELARALSVFPGETHLAELSTGKDAASASKSEVRELRKRFLE